MFIVDIMLDYCHVKIELFMILGSFRPFPWSKAKLDQVFQILPNHTNSSQIFWVLSLMSPNTHGIPNNENLNTIK